MNYPLRVAIAGCHRMLSRKLTNHNFAAAFDAVAETAVVALFDLGVESRTDFLTCWGAMPAYAAYAQMLAEVKPDIVCVATRQTMHADMIEQAAAAGVRGILSHLENWPAGPAMVRDLVHAIASGMPTACETPQARRATEIGFAFHLSQQQDGVRVQLPAADRTLSIPSFPWGNG